MRASAGLQATNRCWRPPASTPIAAFSNTDRNMASLSRSSRSRRSWSRSPFALTMAIVAAWVATPISLKWRSDGTARRPRVHRECAENAPLGIEDRCRPAGAQIVRGGSSR
jgi:hypothetical protein